jgi:NAD(P)-dependent dehydrogenase (short-subunit alcohol dehydrogenase family)
MSMDSFREGALTGKSILVTGGGGGLGLEISKALAGRAPRRTSAADVHKSWRAPQVRSPNAAPSPPPTTFATSATLIRSRR